MYKREMSDSMKRMRDINVKKRCKGYSGMPCKNTVLLGDIYCEECKLRAKGEGKELVVGNQNRHTHYTKFKRDRRSMEFYNSKEWRKKRKEILIRDKGFCQICRRKGYYRKGNTVHHIIPLRENRSLGLTSSNLELVCQSCHNEVHARMEKKNM